MAAIGNFDGVHLGHREILAQGAKGRRRGARASSISFNPTRSNSAARACAVDDHSFAERLRLLVRRVWMRFWFWLSTRRLQIFARVNLLQQILVGALAGTERARRAQFSLWSRGRGRGKRAGCDGRGTGFCSSMCTSAARTRHGDFKFGGSRPCGGGRCRRARWMLGRHFAVFSTQARGRGIGTPAADSHRESRPLRGFAARFGVYVTRLKVNGRAFQAVTNVGNRPTFGEASFASRIATFWTLKPIEMNGRNAARVGVFAALARRDRVAVTGGAEGADLQGCSAR